MNPSLQTRRRSRRNKLLLAFVLTLILMLGTGWIIVMGILQRR